MSPKNTYNPALATCHVADDRIAHAAVPSWLGLLMGRTVEETLSNSDGSSSRRAASTKSRIVSGSDDPAIK